VSDSVARSAAQRERSDRNARARAEARAAEEKAKRVVDVDERGAMYLVTFPYNADVVAAIRDVPGRRWDGSRNVIPVAPRNSAALREFVERFEFTVTADAQPYLDAAADVEVLPTHRVEYEAGKFCFHYPKDQELLNKVRAMPGRRWDPDAVRWTVPEDEGYDAVKRFIAENSRFVVSEAAQARLRELAVVHAERAEVEAKLEAASNAMEAHREVATPEGLKLRPFQTAGVEYALMTKGEAAEARARGCFIADDMGTGKTIQALMALQEADAYPAVVVVRSSIKRKWADEARLWSPERHTVILDGTKPDRAALAGADIIIVNYDILAAWAGTVGKDYVRKGPRRKDADNPGLLTTIGVRGLVVDESHYGKTPDALRTRALLMVAESMPGDGLILNLTGTPVLNRPIELAAQLAIIGRLQDFGGYWKYAKRYAAAYNDGYGMNVSGSSNEKELHDRLRRSCYIRRTKEQVLPELPAIQVARLPMELDRKFAAEYREAERDVVRWVVDQVEADEEFMRSIEDLDEESRKRAVAARKADKAYKARAAEELVRLNALRRICARDKVATSIEWAQDFLDSSDEKLVIFAHHKDVQKAMYDAFPGAARIHADDNDVVRHEEATRFQTDPACRVIVCSMEAAREGIDLFAASNTLFIEYGWNSKIHEQAEARCHRMGQTADSVTAWYTLAEGTIDEDMHALIEAKRAVADAVTDGKAAVRDVSIQRELIERLKRKSEYAEYIAAAARED